MSFTDFGDVTNQGGRRIGSVRRVTPQCIISINGVDKTQGISAFLLSITIHEMSSHNNDSVTLELDDRDPGIPAPPAGASVGVQIGYVEDGSLIDKGSWQVDEFTRSMPPKILEVTARAFSLAQAAPNASLKTNRDESYNSQSVDQIHQTVAGRNGLGAITDGTIGSSQVDHRDQNSQSDMAFLTHLANDFGGVWKVENGQSIISPLGQSKSVSGQDVTSTDINLSDCIDYKYTSQGRSSYGVVQKQYHDTDAGQTMVYQLNNPAVSGMEGNSNNPDIIHKTGENYPNETEAAGAAQSTANALQTDDFTFTVPGIPELSIDCFVNAIGFSSEMPTTWVIIECTHKYMASGYTTTCSCQPQGGFGNGAVGGTSMPLQPDESGDDQSGGQDGSQGDEITSGGEGN